MSQQAKRRGKPKTLPMTHFIFEIIRWEPGYSLSVDNRRDRKGPYNEFAHLAVHTACTFPETLAGRAAYFQLSGKRDCLEPEVFQRDPSWNARCVGMLELPPSRGCFYTSVPHDSLLFLLTSLSHGLFRFVMLYGPILSRGKSFCSSMELLKSVDPEDL